MAPQIKFTYFDLKARGEYGRLILAYSGLDFEDERVNFEGWPTLKPRTPFGFLPVLEYNGRQVSSSIGIARFLANELNLAGKDNFERAQADEVVDQVQDLFNNKFRLMFEKDEAKKKSGLEELLKISLISPNQMLAFAVKVPNIVQSLEKHLKLRGGQFLVGNTLTWADIIFFYLATEMTDGSKGLKDAPGLANLVDRISELPNIKAYMERRPQGSRPF